MRLRVITHLGGVSKEEQQEMEVSENQDRLVHWGGCASRGSLYQANALDLHNDCLFEKNLFFLRWHIQRQQHEASLPERPI